MDRQTRRLLLALGAVFALMNSVFYLAIDRLPLGTVAAIEFLPVILLAALGVRHLRNGIALALAVPGVYVLTDVRLASEPLGIAFAFANAALFGIYIVLAHRVSRSATVDRLDGLAAAMLIAAAAITPIGIVGAATALLDPVALGAGIGVGLASSVIPYVCDQLAMARLKRATYSLMVSLLPATATVTGILVLAQIPSLAELLGVGLIVSAVAVQSSSPAMDCRRDEGLLPDDSRAKRRRLSRKHIRSAIDASLTLLGMDYVDLYQIHRLGLADADRGDDGSPPRRRARARRATSAPAVRTPGSSPRHSASPNGTGGPSSSRCRTTTTCSTARRSAS
jgi:inner membrane transporter RhtA